MLLQGKDVPVSFVLDGGAAGVSFDGRKVTVRTGGARGGRRLLYAWVRRKASLPLKQSLWRQSRALGVTVRSVQVRDQRSRWGSCSGGRTVSLNFRLFMAPGEVMDYVVLHELVHLTVPNHSRAFWSKVEEHCPRYREHRLWLRKNGHRLKVP